MPYKDPIKLREYQRKWAAAHRKPSLRHYKKIKCRTCDAETSSQSPYCEDCRKQRQLEKGRRFCIRAKNLGYCWHCKRRPALTPSSRCATCIERQVAIKREAFAAYGGASCYCCAESRDPFLALDHINNDGKKDAWSNGKRYGGHFLYRKLKKLNWPPGYRVACHNCNFGRYLNGGTCPHASG